MKNTVLFNQEAVQTRPGLAIRSGIIILLLTLLPNLADSAENVSAKYTRSNGRELVISITVAPPTPSSIILVQKLPPGIRITHAQPAAKNINMKKGQAKWLLKEITPGTQTVRMSLHQAVAAQDISATVRYKPANGGKMLTLPVEKP